MVFSGGSQEEQKTLSAWYILGSPEFLGYIEKMHHAQGQKHSIKCAYREKACKVTVVRMHIDYLFPIGNKNY